LTKCILVSLSSSQTTLATSSAFTSGECRIAIAVRPLKEAHSPNTSQASSPSLWPASVRAGGKLGTCLA
jgi:hypothetical protein